MVFYPALNTLVKDFGEFETNTTKVSAYGKNNAAAVKIMDRSGWQ